MIKRITKKHVWLTIALFIVVAFSVFYYSNNISPTKVGLINYPEFLQTKIIKSKENDFIKVETMKPDELEKLSSYDMLLIFGMGIELQDEYEQMLEDAGSDGVKIYVQSSTNPDIQLTNINGKQLERIEGYLSNGGKRNYRNLLNYIRQEIDGKSFGNKEYADPKSLPNDVLFYAEEEEVFELVKDFEAWTIKNHIHKDGNKRVALFTSIPGPFNANRDHMDSLIRELERQDFNVYPIAGFAGRLSYLKEINPDLIVYMPHGRLSMGGSSKAFSAWLEKQNVPVLCPVSVFQKYDDWVKDRMGMFGGLLSQSVTMPEFDGGIVPYATFAQYEDEDGLLLFKAIPGRLEKFGQIAKKYAGLREKENKDKKIAVVYFKGPGKNALNAANLEVLPSLYNMLQRLKVEGYDLGEMPEDFDSFRNLVYKEGPVLGPYAEGAFDDFLENGNPLLIPVEEYENWCHKHLPNEIYQAVVDRYGKAPGAYMSVYKEGREFLAVAELRFGNISLLPQPLPGLGDNEFALIHGAKVAPPHAYISPYLWIQEGFDADAIFHFGTHGSLEFTSGKQIALSDYDWTDPLIGTTPHFYVYTISNVGEGMIAKRRSYAVTQSHLTPPFIEARAFVDRNKLNSKLLKYQQAKGSLKKEYAESVKKMVVEHNIFKDLGLDSNLKTLYTDEEMQKLSNYIEEIEYEKVTGGLYTMGTKWAEKSLKENVVLMYSSVLADYMFKHDQLLGIVEEDAKENMLWYNQNYTDRAKEYIHTLLRENKIKSVEALLITPEEQNRADKWKKSQSKKVKRKRNNGFDDSKLSSKDKLKKLLAIALTDEKKRDFLSGLESKENYDRAISMQDPKTMERAKKMARFIPAMKEALEIAEDPVIVDVISLISDEKLKEEMFVLIKGNALQEQILAAKEAKDNILMEKALSANFMEIQELKKEKLLSMDVYSLLEKEKIVDFYLNNKSNILELIISGDKNSKALLNYLQNDFDHYYKDFSMVLLKKKNAEEKFSEIIYGLSSTLSHVLDRYDDLANSPERELDAIINSLSGGYTPITSGGDPISNPSTIPTGRNLTSVSAESTPTKESWEVGKQLGDALLEDYKSKHGAYPEKVSFTLWSSSFIESEGATIAQILYLLGVEPVWDPFGRVRDVKVIDKEILGRPYIDVLVQTSGQLRDLAASRLFLINLAIEKVNQQAQEGENYVSKGMLDAEKILLKKGFSPAEARKLSSRRIFGGVNGNYGTGIMDMVENSGRWDSTRSVAETYINNMGAAYGDEDDWGEFNSGVFEAAMQNASAVVQPRQSNTWGALSLDHVYEFMGGINLAIKEVTGNEAESYFNDFRNSSSPRIQSLKEAIQVEARTTLLNPRYIKEYMKGGASSAETFSETYRNTFGWNVMKPDVIEDRLWDDLYDTYVLDKNNLGVREFFERENPYALQEMTAVMLETIRKDMWSASPEQIEKIANLHGELVKNHEAGCSGFVCDNSKLRSFINDNMNSSLSAEYQKQIDKVRERKPVGEEEEVVLKKDEEKIQKKDRELVEEDDEAINKTYVIVGALLVLTMMFIILNLKRRKK